MRLSLRLFFVSCEVLRPLWIILARGFKPKVPRGQHSRREVSVSMAGLALTVQHRAIIENCFGAASSKPLPHGSGRASPLLRSASSLFRVMKCCCWIWRSGSSKHFHKKGRGTVMVV